MDENDGKWVGKGGRMRKGR